MTEANKPTTEHTSAVRRREGAVSAREETATKREGAAAARDEVADQRDDTASLRDDAAGVREEAAGMREDTSTVREEAVSAREEAAEARSELDLLMGQLREANERLIVGTIRAQTMTEVAEEANQLKDEFLAAVSHELRTPLNAIVGWARILAMKQSTPEVTGHGIAAIERNAWALAHIIDDLLDMSRIATGTLHMATHQIDLVAIVQAAIETVQPLAATKNIQLTFSPDRDVDGTISGDAGRLEQVIWNLVANAIKFTPEGGRVDVFLARRDSDMEIKVVDTGQGINPDFLPHVFGRFRQGEGATTARQTGLGLGLSIVRQLVELHRGTVHAASEGAGRGATFTVRLPISPPNQVTSLRERRGEPELPLVVPPVARLDALRILVVDDSVDGRELTAFVLTQAGATVTTAASVREALQLLEAGPLNAVVSEISLAGEDGFELIRQIRAFEVDHGGFLPVVAVTGYARAEDRARVLAAGFQAHIAKPAQPAELTSAIAAVAADRRKREL